MKQEQASGLSQVVSVFKLDSSQASYNAAPQRTAPAYKSTPQKPPPAKHAIAAPRRNKGVKALHLSQA